MPDHIASALPVVAEPSGMDVIMGESPARTKVLIFDRSQMGCELLRNEMEKSVYGIQVIGLATSSLVIDIEQARQADVALISASLKEGPQAGFTVLRALHSIKSIRCVMLLNQDSRDLVLDAFRWGACGIFARVDSCEVLCKCVFCVHQGQIWASNLHVEYLMTAFNAQSQYPRTTLRRNIQLTSREEQVIALVVSGKTNRDIARELRLSEHTVKNHLFRLFRKLSISSRSELVAHMLQRRGQTRQ